MRRLLDHLTVRDTAVLAIGLTILGRGLYMLAQVVTARTLGPDGFGVFALAWTLAGIGTIIFNLGIPQNAIRFDVWGRSLWTTGYLPVGLVSTTLAALGLFALAEPLGRQAFDMPELPPVIRAIAPCIPLTVIVSIAVSGFKGEGRALLAIAFASVGLSVGPLLLLWIASRQLSDPMPAQMALAYSLGLVPGALLVLAMTHRRRTTPVRLPPLVEQVRFGYQSLLVHSVGILNMWIDRMVMGFFVAPADLGHYQAASQLSMIPMMLGATIASIYEARLARAATTEVRTRHFIEAQLYQIHAVSLGCLIGIFTAPFWLDLLFGADFAPGGAMLAMLLAGQIGRAAGGPAVITLSMAGLPHLALRTTIVSLVVNLVLNFALVPWLGGLGAALGSAIAALVLSAQSIRLCLARGLIANRFDHLRGPAVALAASFLAIGVVHLAMEPGAGRVLMTLVLGVLAYLLPITFLSEISDLDHIALATRRRLRGTA